ncbi:MAG: hypothetical protein QOJ45_300 [Verrucomicrobiota bacterium]|jgi:DNA-binding transcriptional LysR family regulator
MRRTYKGVTSAWLGQGFNLRHLQYFLAAANAGSMNAAEGEAGVTQSEISRAIRALEGDLNVQLFHRVGSAGVELTKAGERLARDAESVLVDFDRMLNRAGREGDDCRPRINIGYAESPTTEVLPLVLPALNQVFPNQQIVTCKRSVKECITQLGKREISCALTVKPLDTSRSSIRFNRLVTYDLQCVVHDKHDFAANPHVPIKQLETDFLLPFKATDSPQYMKDLQRLFAPHGIQLKTGPEFEDPSDILGGVVARYGFALLLESARHLSPPNVKWLPLHPRVQAMEVGVIYRHPPNPLMREVLTTIEKATQSLRQGTFATRAGFTD